ncbi:MAG: AEC family transporter [Betaproteobacteria bacterium]|nr:AEC family transporter [Betaproteobacteria bacterium]
MLRNALLLFPDFALIVLGFAIAQWTTLKRDVWVGVERLVYYVLFPVLLFSTTCRSRYTLSGAAAVLVAGIGALLCGIAFAYAAFWLKSDRRCTASGVQCGFRFNSFIALAVANSLGGAQAVSLVAVLIAFGVPLCNAAAVWALARHGQRGLARELARNPLLVATAAGLAAHSLALNPPSLVLPVLDRIGSASIAMGLMTVGAGLQIRGIHREWRLTAWLMAVRHALIPLVAWSLAHMLHLNALDTLIVVMFGALPTASSAYVLASRMGGDGPYVAGLVSLSTLLGALSLPIFMALAARG